MTHPTKTIYHPSKINREQKEKKNGHQSAVLWFTGLYSLKFYPQPFVVSF